MGIALTVICFILIFAGFGLALISDNMAYMLVLVLGIPFGVAGQNILRNQDTVSRDIVQGCMDDASKLAKEGEPCMKNLLTRLLADGKMTRYEFNEYEAGVEAWNNRVFAGKIDEFKFGVSK